MSFTISHFNWKKAFLLLSVFVLILMPLLSHQYGQNGDENVEMIYGRDIWNYYAHGNKQALDYDNPPHPLGGNIQGMQYYGGMFDIITEAISQLFPSWHLVDIRHFIASLLGALLITFTGLLTFRLSGKRWDLAFWASLFLLLSPRIFGESMNNGKDIPFALGMVAGLYYLVKLLQDASEKKHSWEATIGLALSWAVLIGTRSAGALLFVMYAGLFSVFYYISNKASYAALKAQQGAGLKKILLYLLVAFLSGCLIGLLSWPYALQSPVHNFLMALSEMSNRTVNLRVLFEGTYMQSVEMPWYYELKWILISNPVVIILLALASLVLWPKFIKKYSLFTVVILFFAAAFPLAYIVYKNSTVYDTWRHVFFVYPFWVILATLSMDTLGRMFLGEKMRFVYLVVLLALLPVIVWNIRSHPNQYVYFNEFVGGAKGAFGNYDLDYYQSTGNQTAAWILKNAQRPKDGKKLIVLSNMDGMDTYFRNDTSWISTGYCRYYERNQRDWDYYISYGRFVSSWQLQNDKWPPANTIYEVKVPGDVPVGIIMGRKSKESTLGYAAFNKQDFAQAIVHYERFLQADQSDEMVYFYYAVSLASMGHVNEAIVALNQAISLDASRPDFYDMLAKIYHITGDKAKEQDALTKMQMSMNL